MSESTMNHVDNIMRLASLLATAHVRRYATNLPNYKGPTVDASVMTWRIGLATAELRTAVEAALREKSCLA